MRFVQQWTGESVINVEAVEVHIYVTRTLKEEKRRLLTRTETYYTNLQLEYV